MENQPQQSNENTRESLDSQYQQLKEQNEILKLWVNIQKKLEEKFSNRSSSFDSLDINKLGAIDQESFMSQAKIYAPESQDSLLRTLFLKTSQNTDKITKMHWSEAWLMYKQELQEINHKMQMIEQKQELAKALDQPVNTEQKLQELSMNSKYTSLVEKFKGTGNLDDLTQMINKIQISSPKRFDHQKSDNTNIVINKDSIKGEKKFDFQISQYKTPKKFDQDDLSSFGSGRPSFLRSELNQTINNTTSPSVQSSIQLKSPTNSFITSLRPEISSKVEKKMNVLIDNKEAERQHQKSFRRKEDLSSYMMKIGLGKYDAPRVTVDLQENKLDKFKVLQTSNKTSNKSKMNSLQELINDPKFLNPRTRKHKLDEQKNVNPSRSTSGGKDAFCLAEQSLKNYTTKLINQHKSHQNSKVDLHSSIKSPQRKVSFKSSFLSKNT